MIYFLSWLALMETNPDPTKFVNPLLDIIGTKEKGKLSIAHRLFIVRSIREEKKTGAEWEKDLASVVPTSRKTINNWVYRMNMNKGMSESNGRSQLCDRVASTSVRREARSHKGTRGVVAAEHLSKLVVDSVKATYNRSRMNTVNVIKKPCNNTIKKYKRKANIVDAPAETGTAARIEAEADLRSAVSFAVGCDVMTDLTCYDLILNADATQFQVGGEGSSKQKGSYVNDSDSDDCIIHAKRARRSACKIERSKDSTLTAYFVKYYCLCNASGMIGPFIFIIADEQMDKTSIDPHRVPGIGMTALEEGWVIFSKTREGGEEGSYSG